MAAFWKRKATEAAAPEGTITVPEGTVSNLQHRLEVTESAMARLEFSREDRGWMSLVDEGKREFSREKLNHHADLCRVYTVANPLIKRGAKLRAAYVFGGGVGTTAKGEDINVVVQDFLDDPEVRDVFSGARAQETNETSLYTDGNVFFALFTDPLTGRVRPRIIPFEEMAGTLTNPEDSMSTWYYRRSYQVNHENGTTEHREELYPDLAYRPLTRPRTIGGLPVNWDTPVYQVKVNALAGWKFGIGDAFAALPWARGYKEFLEDFMLMAKALSRISFQRVDTRGKNTARARRSEVQGIHDVGPGSVANSTDGSRLEAVNKSGANVDSNSGQPLAVLCAAALDLPVTILLSDPGTTGARAVAETLDRPLELVLEGRQEVWREARQQILNHVIDQAVLAPRGPLRGKGRPVRDNNRLTVELSKPEDRTLDIVFPDISKDTTEQVVNAVVTSAQFLPPRTITSLLLRALGERDVDETLDKMFDEDGNWLDDPNVSLGNAAAAKLRRGEDPSELI